jgi:hypothetical protein
MWSERGRYVIGIGPIRKAIVKCRRTTGREGLPGRKCCVRRSRAIYLPRRCPNLSAQISYRLVGTRAVETAVRVRCRLSWIWRASIGAWPSREAMLEDVDRVFQARTEGRYRERTRFTRDRVDRKQAVVKDLGKRRARPKEAAPPQCLGGEGIAVLRVRMILVSGRIDLIAKLFHSRPLGAQVVAFGDHRMRCDGCWILLEITLDCSLPKGGLTRLTPSGRTPSTMNAPNLSALCSCFVLGPPSNL